jgi:hypothetical protein
MPELDFAGLRQEAESVYRPHFETVRRRVRQRRRRRAAGVVAIGVACVVAAGGVVYAGVVPGGGTRAGAPGRSGTVDGRWGVQVGDLTHLYAPYQRCQADGTCGGPEFDVSADQGHSWRVGTAPTVPEHWGLLAFRTLGPETLVLTGDGNPTYLVSIDSGGTWQARQPGAPVPALPAGWRVLELAPAVTGDGPVTEYTVIVGDPVTGALAPLADRLRLTLAQPAHTVPDSAGIWLTGYHGDALATAVSRDGGATWTVTELDGSGGSQDLAILGYAQGTAYAAAQPRDRGRPATLYRSADNGASWHKVTSDTPVPDNANLLNGLVLDDGRILVPGGNADQTLGPGQPTPTAGQGSARGLLVSADAGRTFHPTDQLPGAYVLYRIPDGYVATHPSTGIWLSRDGTTWTAVAQP